MSYRPNIQARSERKLRHEGWPRTDRETIVHHERNYFSTHVVKNRTQGKYPNQDFSKSFCKGSRPNIQARMEQNPRHEGWPRNNRKTIVHNWTPSQSPTKAFHCKGKEFIRLFCPHCHTRCLTFVDYKKHLHADKHLRAMGRRIIVIEREIENKRKEQAEAQATADRAAKIRSTSPAVEKYCAICDLKFYQEESAHIVSKLHIVLQELLEPICNICLYQAKDAVDYENHICSLDHLKEEERRTGEKKECSSQSTENAVKLGENRNDEALTSSEDGTEELSTSNNATTQSRAEDSAEHIEDPIHSNSEQTNIFIKEALYCAYCNLYFNCDEGQESAKVNHCNTQQHLIKHEEAKKKLQDASQE